MARNKQWKAIQVDWATLQGFSDASEDSAYYELTPRQAAFLQAWTEFGMWQSRWLNLGETMDNIHNFVAQVNLNLMIENSIVTFDCTDVETCLASSAIIAAINAQIAQNASDISDNTDNIDTNITNITNLQGRMTSAEGAIAQHSLDIAQNEADIVLQAVLINDNLVAIQANDLELANHETRIIALEAGGGGGGGTAAIRTTTYIQPSGGSAGTNWTSIAASVQAHHFIYPTALIMLAVNCNNTSGSGYFGRIKCDDDIGLIEVKGGSNSYDVYRLKNYTETFYDIDISQPVDITFQLRAQAAVAAVTGLGHFIWTIIEYATAPIISPNVTFDDGGYPYTLSAQGVGEIKSGGNPDNCLANSQTVQPTKYIGFIIDLGSDREMTAWSATCWDTWDNNPQTFLQILVDDVEVYYAGNWSGTDSWYNRGSAFSAIGRIVEIRHGVVQGASHTMKIDNFVLTLL